MPYPSKTSDPGNGCVISLVGTILLISCLVNGCNEIRYRTSSVQTMAHVSYSWTAATKNGGHRNVSEYDFKVGGKEYGGRGGDHNPGDQIPVEYVASNPALNRESGTGQPGWTIFGSVLGLLIIVVGFVLMNKNDDLLSG